MPIKTSKKQGKEIKSGQLPRYRTRAKHNGFSDNCAATRPLVPSRAELMRIRESQLAMPFLRTVELRRVQARPFLKWAGGKGSLLAQFDELFPRSIDRYFEPFLGSGAVFFHLKYRFPTMRAFLRDSNEELINCYRVVRDRPIELMRWLDHHQKSFRSYGAEYYYRVRKENHLTDDLARAARTIFLNKTCFNGLYRVNARGEFNTPIGSNRSPSLYNRENLLAASAALQDVQLEAEDFRSVVNEARKGDFVYLDPPYIPISIYSDFKRYTPDQFREADQIDLARVFRDLDAKGCRVALSGSDHAQTRRLYVGYHVHTVSAPRAINCRADKRGNISELLVTNFRATTNRRAGSTRKPTFPETKYMGSKRRLLPFILKHFAGLKFNSVLDAFSGSGCVGYALKQTGAQVFANDFLHFCFHIARATIENNSTLLEEQDIQNLLKPARSAGTFVRDTYKDLFFDESDCEFLDHLWSNIERLDSPLKKSLALAAACRACMKKRPRGLFTFTGRKGWDSRLDLKLSMRDQFVAAVTAFNKAVFSNGQENRAFNEDVFEIPQGIADVVYIDTPYISPYSDCDYTRRYHFVEGFCRYWKGVEIIPDTTTKKFRSYETAFATHAGARAAFQRLFYHFRRSILVVSYSSHCLPTKSEIIDLLKQEKKSVVVHEASHRYHSGNHAHRVGKNNSHATEYLFVAQ